MHIRFNNTTKIWEYDNGGVWTALLFHLTGGNVGIGTTNPVTLLDVRGSIRAGDGATQGYIQMSPGTASQTGYLEIRKAGGSVRLGYIGWDNNQFAFTAENGAHFVFNNGNVGIGTTSPAAKLEVRDQVRVSSAATGSFVSLVTYDAGGGHRPSAIRVSNDGTGGSVDVATFTSGGRVGIGTNNPGHKLTVDWGDVDILNGKLRMSAAGAGVYWDEAWGWRYVSDGTHPLRFSGTSLVIGFDSMGTNFGSSNLFVAGNIGIGAASTGEKFRLHNVAAGTTDRRLALFIDGFNGGANGHYFAILGGNGGINVIADWTNLSFGARADGTLGWKQTLTVSFQDRVGIGVANPEVKLSVVGAANSPAIRISGRGAGAGNWNAIDLSYDDAGSYSASIRAINKDGSPSYMRPRLGFFTQNTDTYLYGSLTERMSILAESGYVGIGTTTPSKGLHVGANGIRVVGLTGSASGAYVRTDGDGVFYWDSSLREYKKNIRKFIPTHLKGFERILDVELHEFEDGETGETTIGVIADELEELGLEFLLGRHEGKLWTVHYEKLSLYLLGLLKQLIPQIRREN